jgi:hypothetical protein
LARDPDLSEKLMKEHFLQGQLAAKWSLDALFS